MKANDKIYVSEYLKDLNERVKHAIAYHHLDKGTVKPLTCKELAESCEVTQATITNLTTNSKFYLLYRVAEEILDAYYGYFMYEESEARKENPDELINPRDKSYVLFCLTTYYTHEWLN